MPHDELEAQVTALIAEANRTLAESQTLMAEVLALFGGRPAEAGVHLLDPSVDSMIPFGHP